MPSYQLIVSDGKTTRLGLEALTPHEAVNESVNAMARFACRNFPPPENLSITVLDPEDKKVATVNFSFEIKWEASRGY